MASIDEVARYVDLSSREVDRLISSGVLPRAERGAHDLDDVRGRYLQHLRERVVRRALNRNPDAEKILDDLLASRRK